MSKIAVIYWSSTGNTELMANKIIEGISSTENEGKLFTCANFDKSTLNDYDIFVLGCPACGSEELDDTEFMPMFEEIKSCLKDKKLALFGSYGWGGGEYLTTFRDACKGYGLNILSEPLVAENSPDDEAQELCINFGKSL